MSQALRANVDINIVYKKNWDKYFLKFSIRYRLRYLVYLKAKTSKGRTIRKVMGAGGGEFSACTFFFFAHCLCRNFFFQSTPLHEFFFSDKYCFFFNSEILTHYLCFCALYIILHSQQIKGYRPLWCKIFSKMYTQWKRRKPLGVDG